MYFIYTENTVTAPFPLGKAARRSRPARAVVAQRRGGGLAEAGRESRSTFDPAAARCAPAGAPPLGAGTAGSCVIGARRREGKDRREGPGRGSGETKPAGAAPTRALRSRGRASGCVRGEGRGAAGSGTGRAGRGAKGNPLGCAVVQQVLLVGVRKSAGVGLLCAAVGISLIEGVVRSSALGHLCCCGVPL